VAYQARHGGLGSGRAGGARRLVLARALLARVAPGRRLQFAPAALALLRRQRFDGNIRELRNVLERATLLADGDVLNVAVLERALAMGVSKGAPSDAPAAVRTTQPAAAAPDGRLRRRGAKLDDAALPAARAAHPGSNEALAQELGLSLRTLYRRLARLKA
jgi:DNA-binding NtrC family response regulator